MRIKNGETIINNSYTSLIPYHFTLKKDNVILGEVILYSSNQVIFDDVKYTFLTLLIAAVIKTMILWVLFIWAFKKFIGKQLNSFCQIMEQANFDNPENSYLRLQNSNIEELYRIEVVYNAMFNRVLDAKNKLDLLNANLEQQVIQRTKEIQIKNEHLEQLNHEKNEFLSIAAHDLKNPLSNIATISYLIEKNLQKENSKEKLPSYINIINTSSRNMFDIINNLLDVNKIETGDFTIDLQEVDILSLLQAIISDHTYYANSKNIVINLNIEGDGYLVMTDKFKLSQILNNIISNAIKYSLLNKTVSITIIKQIDFIYIKIQDQGQGFSEADKEKLFTKFSRLSSRPTANEHSTGLGLYIVKKLADSLGIMIAVESNKGEGASFSLEIPLNVN